MSSAWRHGPTSLKCPFSETSANILHHRQFIDRIESTIYSFSYIVHYHFSQSLVATNLIQRNVDAISLDSRAWRGFMHAESLPALDLHRVGLESVSSSSSRLPKPRVKISN